MAGRVAAVEGATAAAVRRPIAARNLSYGFAQAWAGKIHMFRRLRRTLFTCAVVLRWAGRPLAVTDLLPPLLALVSFPMLRAMGAEEVNSFLIALMLGLGLRVWIALPAMAHKIMQRN